MKKSIFLIIFLGILGLFNNCTHRYVAEEPTFLEVAPPPRPSPQHVWKHGDWSWNPSAKLYVRSNGQWVIPNQGRTYMQGHWNSTRRGKYWVPGRWR